LMRNILAVLGLLFTSYLHAQNKIIDSLLRVSSSQKDTHLIKTYNELTWQYRLVDPGKAIFYGNKAIQLSTTQKFDKGLAQAFNDLGIIYYDRQNFDSALILYNQSFVIRKAHSDMTGMAALYNKIGIAYQKQGEFQAALNNQLNALEIYEQLNNNTGISYSLNNIGILCQNLGRYDDAVRYHEQSIKVKEKINDRYGLSGSYVNLANVYLLQEEFSKAQNYYEKAVSITRSIEDKEYLSNALNNLSRFYIRTKKYREAEPYAKESFLLREKLGDIKGMVSCLINLGDIYAGLENYDNAEEVLIKANNLGKGVASCKPEMVVLYESFSKLYEKKGKFDKALYMHKSFVLAKDSIFSDNLSQKFAELQVKYESEKKEKQIAILNTDNALKVLEIKNQQLEIERNLLDLSQNRLALSEADLQLANDKIQIQQKDEKILQQKLDSTQKSKNILALQKKTEIQKLEIANRQLQVTRRNVLVGFLIAVVLLGALLGSSYYRRYKLKQEARMQLTLLRQQDEATKAVLEAEENERQRIAKDLHDGVGQMMSAAKMNLSAYESNTWFKTEEEKLSFEKIILLVDESCKEVRTVSHNMMPNALLKNSLAAAVREFIDKLDHKKLQVHLYTDGLEDRLDSNMETVLYRVIQECVNNVIKHADASTLDISIIREKAEVTATIEDNGKGFNTSDKGKFDGIGLKNIRTRVEYLKGTVDFGSSPGKGTLVALHIPL
jgi:two-component system, NarL family, sensor kinase